MSTLGQDTLALVKLYNEHHQWNQHGIPVPEVLDWAIEQNLLTKEKAVEMATKLSINFNPK